ncbi:LamG-like jellyroll fold domain-containing protein [Streptomyces sp. NPDC001678]|uniref:LamG-like jellyroll fold domain-containing protein n=1 Tax=Streptomyces sp. NPDC001678 TaxID=3364599 RepID=UPI0036B70D5B
MLSRPYRRSTRWRRLYDSLTRGLAVVALATLAMALTCGQAAATGATLTPVPLPSLGSLASWLTGHKAPDWGRLPHQATGSAADRGHNASTGSTRAGHGAGQRPAPGKGELPAYEPYARKATKGPSAGGLGFNARTSKRVASKSTATSDYYQNEDGSYTKSLSPVPVNFRDGGGDWQRIDTTIHKGSDGRLHQEANSFAVDFAPRAADSALARVAPDGKHAVAYGLQGAAAVEPEVSGSTAQYRGVLPETDLELHSVRSGLKESVVLHSAKAGNEWTFPLDTQGLRPVLAKDGSVQLLDGSGKASVVIPPAYAYDAGVDRASGDHATTHAVSYRLVESGGKTTLRMTLDASWLHAKERVFPVVVDPSYHNVQPGSTYAESGEPGDHSMELTTKVGSWDSGPHSAVSYFQFPTLGLDNSQVTVTAAELDLYAVWSSTCTPQRFDVAPVTKAWTPQQVTSWPGPSYGSSIGNLTPNVPVSCNNKAGDLSKGDYLKVPLSTAVFNKWASATGATDDYGLAVSASTSDNLHWKQFGSVNNPDAMPNLFLTYTGALLPQVLSTSPANNAPVNTLTPQLTAVGSLDTHLGTRLKYDFQVYDTDGNKLADSGLTTTDYFNVPAGKLKWGKSYYWEVQSYDGTNYSAGPNWQLMTTQVPQPAVTSSLSQNTDGHGYSPAIGNYTTSAVDANVSTPGPSLTVTRDYNSRDPRVTGAFGAGWSSVFDAKAAEQYDATGAVTSVQVTYPDGSAVGYGKNPDGSFAPPQGRFATFAPVSGGGYTLTDKSATVYAFTQALGSGAYGLTSITDANGRTTKLVWSSGRVTTMTSAVSGRSLYLTWSTPSGATAAHVATVATDPATAGQASTASTWTYSYTGDQLNQVCSPVDTSGCARYGYASGSQYHNQVLDQGPSSYWPLAESSGTTAASSVLARAGADNATYSNVTLGQPGPLAGSGMTAADFNGTSSSVKLPNLGIGSSTAQSVSLWFKTSTTAAGVLFSYSDMPVKDTATKGDFMPSLYIGSDGKLMGLYWYGPENPVPITTSGAVTDGKWHHVVLAGSWSAQTMWLDGNKVGTAPGSGTVGPEGTMPWLYRNVYLGAGYLGANFPDQPHYGSQTLYGTYFKGSISSASYFEKPLTQANVTDLYRAGTKPAGLLSSVTRPSGKTFASVSYDPVTADVTRLTDSNGGTWTMGAPTVQGSSEVYRASVLGTAPAAYYRLGDPAGAGQAVNEVNSGAATYANATLGSEGPFTDTTGAAFNGSSSFVQLPASQQVQTGPNSVEMWFRTPAGSTAGGVLFSQSGAAVNGPNPTANDWTPALYVGTDGKVHGKFWDTNGVAGGMVSSALVNDGKWHHTLLTGSAKGQHLYVDGVQAGSTTAALKGSAAGYNYIGAGESNGWPARPTNALGYFSGSIAEAAFYRSELSGGDAAAHWSAGRSSNGLSPLKVVKVTDPGTRTVTYQYDLWNGNRAVAQIDGRGYKTTYGYDTAGFQHTVTDPNGNVVTTGHDVRGNEVARTTCQNQAAQACSTTYTTYLPDDTSTQLTPNPQNDLPATVRDGRSSSATDNTYLTSFSYDAAGNQTGVTTPAVPGSPNGRTTTIAYTDGTSIAAADGGFAPKGLPYKTVSPGGATTTITYFKNGDVASTTDPNGQVTGLTYDNLGRPVSKKVVSDTFPGGLVTQYKYDAESQVVEQTDPAVTNRVTGAVHQARTSTVYDADGLVTSQTVADLSGGDASRTVSSTYNQYNQLETNTDATKSTTSFTYDAYGNKATERDALGTTLAFAYDAEGHLLTQTLKDYTGDPANPSPAKDLVQSSRAYDPAGRLQSITDAMGNTTSYTYTDNDLTATITKSDPSGKNTFVQQANTYDAAGNLIEQATNNGATVTKSTVDAADRVVATTIDPTGVNRTTTVSYTPDDRVATSTLSDGSGTTHTTSSAYDAMGNLTSRSVRQDGVGRPTGWWPLNQTSGTTVTDASGTGNTAVAKDVTWNDGAASFNGTTSVIGANGPVLDTASSYSVSTWVKLNSQTADSQTLIGQGGADHQSFYLNYRASTKAWAFVTSTNDGSTADYPVAFSPAGSAAAGTWTHLVATFDSGTGAMKLYVNGQPAGTATNSSPWNAPGQTTFGAVHTTSGGLYNQFSGALDNVQTYPRALSGDEVARLYGADRSGGTTASSGQATTSWKLDKRGLPVSMTDADGNVTGYAHDEAGHQTVTVAPAVNAEINGGAPALVHPTTTVGYNTFGDQSEAQDPNGNTVTTAYDAEGRKTAQTLPDYTPPGGGTPIAGATTNWTYDALGNVTLVTDPLRHTTGYVYDQLSDVVQVTDANKGVTRTVFDANGDALSVTSPSGAQTQATYDFMGRKLTTTTLERFPSPVTSTTTHSYAASAANPGGAFLASTTTQNGVTTSYGYNRVGEITQVTDAAGNTTQNTYDLKGQKTAVGLPDGTWNTVTYDQLGNPVRTQSLDTDKQTVLSTRSATYSAAGQLLSSTDANQHTTTFTRDALGQVTGEVQPVDATHSITTGFGYDQAGHRTRFTDGRGNARYYTFNSWNLPESVIEPPVSTTAYSYTSAADSTFTTSYDAAGRAVTHTAPGGVKVTSDYDALGSLTTQSGSGAEIGTATRSFGYDAEGRMTSAATSAISGTPVPATSNTFTYNDRGLLLTAAGTSGSSSFAYNGDGLVTTRTDAAGTTGYGYDNAGRLSTLTDPATGTQLTYTYNNLSKPTRIQYTQGGKDGNVRSFGYDKLHRLTNDTLKTAAGNTVASIGYGYDTNGNQTSRTTTGLAGPSNHTYTYDWADRLTSWNDGNTTTAYGYDDSGNRVRVGSNVYAYDARDQLTSDGVNTYRYSARGTLTQQSTATGTPTVFASDAFDQQLTQGTQTYVTDALGRVVTANGAGGAKLSFAYTGTGNTLASDGGNTYTWTPDGGLIGIGTPGGSVPGALALTDQHDDVIGNFTAAGTDLSGSTAYDPLGNPTGTTGAPLGHLGYQSGWTDNTTGKVNMAARWYNPAAGQFMNRDTMAFDPVPNSVTANPFAYVDDNPLKGTDPSGHGFWGNLKRSFSSGLHSVTSYASSAYDSFSSWTSSAYDTVSSWASSAYDTVSSWSSSAYHATTSYVKRASHVVSHYVHRAVSRASRAIHDGYRHIRRAAGHAYHATKHVVSHAYHHTVQAVKTAYHATAKAVNTAAAYVKKHAGAIASFVASAAVFAGCEAALGAATGGVGAVVGAAGCGALAGAVGGAINQGAKCMSGQSGGCSVGAFAGAVGIGAVGGAIGGALGGALGGKLAESALGKALPKVVTGALEGAAIGGMTGGAVGAAGYGIACSRSGAGCSWSGAGRAAAEGVREGAVDGAAMGAVAGAMRHSTCGDQAHSFTGETRVAMANGSSKRIDEVKAGDEIRNAVPGKPGATETHKVDKVIVTRTDRDFVDVTVAPTTKTGGLGARALKKAAAGLTAAAAAAAVLAPTTATASTPSASTITTTYHHPFYDQTRSAFVEAKDLHEGDLLETENGSVEVKTVRLYHADAVTYDLTVDGLHTYYVLADTTPVLVHNCELSDRAQDIRNVIHDGSKGGGRPYKNQTVAVIRADKGDGTPVDVVAASGDGLTSAQLGALKSGEEAAVNDPSLHAETNAMQHISNNNWTLWNGGASRNVCPYCENSIRSEGGELTGPSAWKGRVNYTLDEKNRFQFRWGQRSFTFGGGGGE